MLRDHKGHLRWGLRLGALAVSVGLGYAGVRWAQHEAGALNPHRGLPAEPESPPPNSPFSEAYHADMARLINRIARHDRWNDADTEWLIGLISTPWPDEVPPQIDETEAFELAMLQEDAMVIVGERIAWGAPVPPAVAASWEEAVEAMLVHPRPHVRQKGVYAVFTGGRADERRAQIERMAGSDPAQIVRRAAHHKLLQHDGQPTPLDDCPTCPKDGP